MPLDIYLIRILSYVVLPSMLGGLVEFLSRKSTPKTPLNLLLSLTISAMAGITLIALMPYLGLKGGLTFIDNYEQLLRIFVLAFMSGFSVRKFLPVLSSKLLLNIKDENADPKIPENSLISHLSDQIKNLEEEITILKQAEKNELLESEAKELLKNRLPIIVDNYIKDGSALNASFLTSLREIIYQKVDDCLKKEELIELKKQKIEESEMLNRIETITTLQKIIQQERTSSSFYKNVMINLFIIVNLGFLLVFIFREKPIGPETIASATGLYLSLAMFIIYIFRVSNARTAVLLAIHEDFKKHLDIERYISKVRHGEVPTKEDVDIIRLLFTNRSEREKGGDHPYEVILKEIANSNIQFKGGKMSIKREKTK